MAFYFLYLSFVHHYLFVVTHCFVSCSNVWCKYLLLAEKRNMEFNLFSPLAGLQYKWTFIINNQTRIPNIKLYSIRKRTIKQRRYLLVTEIPLSAVALLAAMQGRAFTVKDIQPAALCCCTLAYMLGFLLLLQTLIQLCSRSQWLSLPKIDTTWAGQHLRNHTA